jgi:hypothetical protein
MAGKLRRFVYKEVLEGDLRKARGESNDAHSGGGARDLRLRPWDGHFEEIVAAMATQVDQDKGRDRYHVDLTSVISGERPLVTKAVFWPPTQVRPNEGRLANIDRIPAFAPGQMPPEAEGRALYFIWQDEDGVYASVISETSLKSGDWHKAVAEPILRDLKLATKTIRGYVDFETGQAAFAHTLS